MKGLGLSLSLTRSGPSGPSYGPELVTNGTFDTDNTGWTVGGSGSLSNVAGKMRLTSGGSDNSSKQTILTLENGATYRFQATMTPSETDRARISLGVAHSKAFYFATDGGSIDYEFVSAATGIDITAEAASAGAWASNGQYAEYDNISLKKVL